MQKMLGVTLVELVVAIIIGMILLALGTVSLRGFLIDNALDNVSGDLFNAIHSARSQAIALGNTVTLCYVDSTQTCKSSGVQQLRMFLDVDNDGVLNTSKTPPDVSLMNSVSLGSYVTISNSQSRLRFSPEGLLLNNASTTTIYNNESGCRAVKIIVDSSGSSQLCKATDAGSGGCPSGSYCP